MTITEPMTMVTDYVLAIESAVLGVWLIASGRRERQRGRMFWGAAFIAIALAAGFGGTAHGFATHLTDVGKAITWKGALFGIGLTSYCMLTAVALTTIRSVRWRAILLGLAPVKLAAFAIWMAGHDEFYWAIVDYAPVLLLVVVLHAVLAWRWRSPASGWIIAGVAVTVGGTAIQALHIAPHEHFNHNDLYHVIQMVGMALFFVGGQELEDLG